MATFQQSSQVPTSAQDYFQAAKTASAQSPTNIRRPISGSPTRGTILNAPSLEDCSIGNGLIDYEVVAITQHTGALSDALVQLKTPRKQLLFIGTDTGASSVDFYLSFQKTGQTAPQLGTGPFLPAQAFGLPIFHFTKLIAFESPILNFYISAVDPSTNPGTYYFVALDDLNAVWTVV